MKELKDVEDLSNIYDGVLLRKYTAQKLREHCGFGHIY